MEQGNKENDNQRRLIRNQNTKQRGERKGRREKKGEGWNKEEINDDWEEEEGGGGEREAKGELRTKMKNIIIADNYYSNSLS